MVVPSYDVRYLHINIINNNSEVISRSSVRAHYNEVVKLVIFKCHLSPYHVIDDCLSFLRHLEPHCSFRTFIIPAPSVIFLRFSLSQSLFSSLLKLFGRAAAVICFIFSQEFINITSINIKPVCLPERALIPFKFQPFHALNDCLNIFFRGACPVRILNPQNEFAVIVACEKIVKKGSPRSSNMQMPGRTRRKTNSYHIIKILQELI